MPSLSLTGVATEPSIEAIYIAPRGGAAMEKVEAADAVAGRGLAGDRYSTGAGAYSGVDECQVLLIEAEGLDEAHQSYGLDVADGQHRRNIVTRGIRLVPLSGKRFQIGEAVLEFDRTRPPCAYLQSFTQPGMMRALINKAGICARVVRSGKIRVNDTIHVFGMTSAKTGG